MYDVNADKCVIMYTKRRMKIWARSIQEVEETTTKKRRTQEQKTSRGWAGLRHHRTRRPGCVESEVRPLEGGNPLGSGQGSGQWAVIQALPFVQSYVSCGWGPWNTIQYNTIPVYSEHGITRSKKLRWLQFIFEERKVTSQMSSLNIKLEPTFAVFSSSRRKNC